MASVFDSFLPVFEAVAETAPADSQPHRQAFEQCLIGREVVNVVACEGLQRVMRSEPVATWKARMEKVGFAQCELPLPGLWYEASDLLSRQVGTVISDISQSYPFQMHCTHFLNSL